MASITLNNIVKRYGNGILAVDGFNLEISDEEFVALVGPSGCGKSTILRMIAGLEDITMGEIYIDGEAMNEVEPKDRNIAMVFQNYALYPHMNVYKNMEFGLKMRKTSKKTIEQQIKRTAKQLKIEDILLRKPAELSGGQKQRVALGRAMVREPKVFLLDEPLSNLDAKLRTEMRVEISSLHKILKSTFVYVTHDQTEAMTIADRIVVMKDGKIQQVGRPREIYKNPANLFVANFIGLPRINILPAKIFKKDNSLGLEICGIAMKFSDGFLAQGIGNERNMLVGIRPEAVVVKREGMESERKAIIEIIEDLGAEAYLYLNYERHKVTARVTAEQTFKIGEVVSIEFKCVGIQLFDEETEANIAIQ